MQVKTINGDTLDLTTGKAMRLIQAGDAVALEAVALETEASDAKPKAVARRRKKNDNSDVAGGKDARATKPRANRDK